MRSLNSAATGMLAQQQNVEVISNNIANMNTTGFMRRRTEFQDLIYQNLRRVGSTSSDAGTIVPSGVQLGLGVKLAAVYRIHEQGNLTATDNTFDLAIQGTGFFQITLPDGSTGPPKERSSLRQMRLILLSLNSGRLDPEILCVASGRGLNG
jgi:flagellar basal-body rod protein FlgG